ncbi:MAG TPA: acetate--CoA ligase family protein [Alphaproteobacteria bacterium]|nr:acetate--CoA ligase family protein [Alphaproteobacteria bacterium]
MEGLRGIATPAALGDKHPLAPLLAPRSIAFVGASPKANTPGNDVVRMALRGGFRGALYPVNPNYGEIEGLTCYSSLAALPEAVDLAVLAIANGRLEQALEEAIRLGARSAVIFASCYLEDDRDPPLTKRLAALARAAGMPICGGNCMGFYHETANTWICGFPSPRQPARGSITLISHAGSVFGALAHNDPRLKYNLAVSAGQELVTSAADYLDYALDQPETRVVGLFLETIRDPAGFMRALGKAVARRIPVVALKVGRTEASAALAMSHSGAIAGNDAAYAALFDKFGVIRVDNVDEMAATLLLFAQGRPAQAGGIAAIHDSGGERELVIDLAQDHGAPFARISPATTAALRARLEYGLEPVNPLDAWGTGQGYIDLFTDCFTALMKDPDTALGIFFNDLRDASYLSVGFSEVCKRVHAATDKPVALATNYSQVRHDKLALALTEAGIPVLDGTIPALQAARHLLAHRDFLARSFDPPSSRLIPPRNWAEALKGRSGALPEAEALALLADYGIPTTPARIVGSVEEACAAAREIGFPVVCKTAEPGVLHKSDVGGVKLDLKDEADIASAYADLAARLGPRVLVAQMARPGTEIALGLVHDRQFGPVVMVAAGGLLVEILRDASYALAPFGAETARRLIDGLAVRRLLAGARGATPADLGALAEVIARFSILAADLSERIKELDVNPLIVGPNGAIAVDALVVLR